jgi:hypothetical protein
VIVYAVVEEPSARVQLRSIGESSVTQGGRGAVAATQGELALELDAGPEYDADERARLSSRLRAELLDLDVHAVHGVAGSPAPDGAKAADMLTVGGLVIVLGLQRHVLRAVVDTVVAWLARQQARSVKLTLDEQSQLMARWVERHAPPE